VDDKPLDLWPDTGAASLIANWKRPQEQRVAGVHVGGTVTLHGRDREQPEANA
jgi:hypothetical protein